MFRRVGSSESVGVVFRRVGSSESVGVVFRIGLRVVSLWE